MPIIVAPIIPTPVVVQSALGDAAWDYLPQYIPDADDGTVRALLDSLAAPVVGLVDVLTDAATTADPSTTQFGRIPWLAAMAGIDISTVASEDRKRAVIGDAAWRYRGTVQAIRTRVAETLTGAKSVDIVTNYGGDPDAISVTTFASQTPDPTATEAAIRAEIPAWMEATIVTNAAGQSYANLAVDYADYGTMTATSKTYGTLSQEV